MRTVPAMCLGAALALLLFASAQPSAQPAQSSAQPPAPAPARIDRTDTSDVTAIVVDVVVRDRRGNPVTDLTAADFELIEDGVRQEIGSFTPIAGASPAAGSAPSGTPAANASVGVAAQTSAAQASATLASAAQAPAIVALVFDRLTPEARAFAHKAAMQYVGDGQVATNVVAVFGIDLSLVFYQPFTRDADRIRQGIQSAGGRGTSRVERARERAGSAEQGPSGATQSGGGSGLPGAAPSAAGTGAAAQGAPPGSNVQAQLMQMESRMVQRFAALEQDAQGFTTANALTAIVSAMRAIPGRKSLVFFSEGLSFSSNVQSRFFSVIDAANRANVSIYPMDAAGLRTRSTGQETSEGLYAASRAVADGLDFGDSADRPRLEALETNEALLRADPHSGLGVLADETGGMLMAGSNDLKTGFTRIDTDLRNYYVLTYVPANTTLDGKYRRIGVKVRRDGLRVHARKGYYAVRPSAGTPLLGHEAPALAALEQTPVPNAFAARAAAFRFPESDHPGLLSVLVHVPTAGITFQEAKDVQAAKGVKGAGAGVKGAAAKSSDVYTSDFVVLVRFRDQAGQVIDKMSQRYQIQGPLDQMARAKQGDVLFYRQPELTPGVYTMEAVVYDALSAKATVRVSTVDVPDVDPALPRLSSLVLVRGSEKLSDADRKASVSTAVPDGARQAERGVGHPLIVGDQILRPLIGEPISKASAKELTFYFVAYPAAAGAAAGQAAATVELLNNAQPIATAPLQLDAPDAAGRIPHVSRLPLESIAPGAYELRVRLRQGSSTATRTLQFRVAP